MALKFYQYRRGDKKPKPAQLASLVSYILSELPTITHGIQVNGKWIDTVVYPTYGAPSCDSSSTSSNAVGIGSIWSMMANLRASEAFGPVFEQLDDASGRGRSPEGRPLRTVAIDAIYPPKGQQLLPCKSASVPDLSCLVAA